jgi:hypothetical protein
MNYKGINSNTSAITALERYAITMNETIKSITVGTALSYFLSISYNESRSNKSLIPADLLTKEQRYNFGIKAYQQLIDTYNHGRHFTTEQEMITILYSKCNALDIKFFYPLKAFGPKSYRLLLGIAEEVKWPFPIPKHDILSEWGELMRIEKKQRTTNAKEQQQN